MFAQLAFRRFNIAFGRELGEDRLIDLWVGLESLFGKSDETQELTYKFAMRIAHFIENDPTERWSLFENMQESYRTRSHVVHGRGTRRDISHAEEAAEDALRRALRRTVVEGRTPDVDELDQIAARGRC